MSDIEPLLKPFESIQLSKLLSYILRHGAVKAGLDIAPDGYVAVEDLLALQKFRKVTFEQIQYVVDTNDKKRYELSQSSCGKWLIRASQGHTLKKVGTAGLLTQITEPIETPVVHGTNFGAWQKIKHQGLSRMERNHIHFACGLLDDPNVKSGMRKSSTVFIFIDTEKARKDNITFYRSENGVILSEGIDGIISTKYFEKVIDKKGDVIEF